MLLVKVQDYEKVIKSCKSDISSLDADIKQHQVAMAALQGEQGQSSHPRGQGQPHRHPEIWENGFSKAFERSHQEPQVCEGSSGKGTAQHRSGKEQHPDPEKGLLRNRRLVERLVFADQPQGRGQAAESADFAIGWF